MILHQLWKKDLFNEWFNEELYWWFDGRYDERLNARFDKH